MINYLKVSSEYYCMVFTLVQIEVNFLRGATGRSPSVLPNPFAMIAVFCRVFGIAIKELGSSSLGGNYAVTLNRQY